MTALVDTNVLIYRYDPRSRSKRTAAARLLRLGLAGDELVLPHQALIEFVAATTRPRNDLGGAPLLERSAAYREAEKLVAEFPILYPDDAVFKTALRGVMTYQLSWFDAHLWAYAEVNGIDEILSEDFEHGRRYGSVRVRDPFLEAADEVHELPPLYEAGPEKASERAGWPIRGYALGHEPGANLRDSTTAGERLAMMWELARQSWSLAGRPLPEYPRNRTPGRVIRSFV